MKDEGDNIKLAHDKLWDDTPRLEGQGGSEGPRPVALTLARHIAAHSESYGNETGAPDVIGANCGTLVEYLKVINGRSSRKVTWLTAQLKCLYTNAYSMGNKQEELEATVLLESYDLVAITETWWDESHDWSDWSGEEGEAEALRSTPRNGWSVKSSFSRIAMSRLKAYG